MQALLSFLVLVLFIIIFIIIFLFLAILYASTHSFLVLLRITTDLFVFFLFFLVLLPVAKILPIPPSLNPKPQNPKP